MPTQSFFVTLTLLILPNLGFAEAILPKGAAPASVNQIAVANSAVASDGESMTVNGARVICNPTESQRQARGVVGLPPGSVFMTRASSGAWDVIACKTLIELEKAE